MLVSVGVLGVALGVVGFAAWWLLRRFSVPSAPSTAVVVVSLWITASAVVVWRGGGPPVVTGLASSKLLASVDSLVWPGTSASSPAPAALSSAAGVQAGSVESLVGGLEARLTEQPNDANGWALLAQSYAFTSNEEAVERTVQRAVALGFDESVLRERVASAQRSAPAFDWVERAIHAREP